MPVTVNTSIPITFEKINHFDVQDTRFTAVKIFLMHLEENLNGSYFSKKSVENAIPTLANTPILGYIETNKDGEEDFSNHRKELVKEDGHYRTKYLGSAFGVIPETNNARYEFKTCDDGVEREFLVVDGLLWNKLEDSVDILERDGIKSQSMEIHSDFTGKYNSKDKLFYFDTFKFYGATFLGDDYNPAMKNASIEAYSTDDEFESMIKDINKKVELFKDFQSQNGTGFSINLDNNVQSNVQEGGNDVTDENVKPEGNPVEENNPTGTPTDFSLTNSQLSAELSRALNPNPKTDEWGYTIYDYWYVDSTDAIVIARQWDNWDLVGFEYTMSGDFPVVNFDSKKRYKTDYIPMEDGATTTFNMMTKEMAEYLANVARKETEASVSATYSTVNTELESLKSQFTVINEEVTSLREFKTNKLTDERKQAEDALFASPEFSALSEEEINGVREKAESMSLEDLENHLFALVGKKVASQFSAGPKKNNSNRIIVDTDDAPRSSKPYAHLIEEVRGSKNK
jgi:hypothetical protein